MLRLDSEGNIWTPSGNGSDGPPPDTWWLVVLTITLSITIPAAIGASFIAVFLLKRRRSPEVRVPPKKVVLEKNLTEDELKMIRLIFRFFSFLFCSKN
ncbi:MAG: hypothetical protein ACTSX4_11490 [Candidatus Helarchaeota archaeon]